MANVILKEGWELNDPRVSSDLVKATISQKDNLGRTIPVVVISNIKTGNFDVYQVPTIQIGGSTIPIPNAPLGTPLFRYDSTNDKPELISRDRPSSFSLYGDDRGQKQLNDLITSVKRSTYEIARLNTGTDPVRNENFENIKNKKGYQSISNIATPGTRPQPQPPEQGGATTPTPTATPGESGSEGTSTPIVTQIGNTVNLPEQPLEISKGVLRYPERMKPEQDKIFFQAVKISSNARGGGETSSLQFSFGEPKYEIVPGGPVVMAVQSPISDQNSVDWGPDNINAIESALYGISLKGMNPQNRGEDAQTLLNDTLNALKTNQGPFQRFLAGYAVGVNNILPRTDGVILNPNLELLFQAPQLRPFTFQFKMSARDEKEAINIKSIIKYFKYHMSVRKDSNDLFLRAPHVFTIQYKKGETDLHPGINLISPANDRKACALTNCSVDYTPLGSYMTFRDTKDPRASGTMVSYTLSLQFQEITPIYNTDYEEPPGRTHPIGY